jgi:hypothetical protein
MCRVRKYLTSCNVQVVQKVIHQTPFMALFHWSFREIPSIQWSNFLTFTCSFVQIPESSLSNSEESLKTTVAHRMAQECQMASSPTGRIMSFQQIENLSSHGVCF